jgi:flagellar biosynthesis protein FliQ
MNDLPIFDLWRSALTTAAIVATPFVLIALAVGLLMSIVQAATQLQENVLTFVPKLIALGVALTVCGPWALGQLTRYTERIGETIVEVGSRHP